MKSKDFAISMIVVNSVWMITSIMVEHYDTALASLGAVVLSANILKK
jgi:hypothetical protein